MKLNKQRTTIEWSCSYGVCVSVGWPDFMHPNRVEITIALLFYWLFLLWLCVNGATVFVHIKYIPSIEPPAAASAISFSCKLFGCNFSLPRLDVSWPLWLWFWCCLRRGGFTVVYMYGVGVVVVVGGVTSFSSVCVSNANKQKRNYFPVNELLFF